MKIRMSIWVTDEDACIYGLGSNHILVCLEKLSIRKSNETWELVPSGDEVGTFLNLGLYWNGLTPPLKSTWDFFEHGIFLKRNDPLKILRNKLNIKNIGTKSINMSDIMVYLAMFSTTIW